MTKKIRFSWKKAQKPLFIMAPMDGITSSPFRRVVKKCGADIVFSEMIAAEAVYYKSKKTLAMMRFHEEERPYIVQIFGNDTEKIAEAVKYIEKEIKPDGIDINMGCPAKKVVAGGRGAALLLEPKKAVEVVKAVRGATSLPLSVKTRIGWDKFDIQLLVRELEKAGIDALTIHARTKKQGFQGEPDLKAIKEIKKLVKIPVIGNGGVKDADSAKEMLEKTGCDGVMIGRGALGNPWIFTSTKSLSVCPAPLDSVRVISTDTTLPPSVISTDTTLPSSVISTDTTKWRAEKSLSSKNNKDYKPSRKEVVDMALWHLSMNIEEFGDRKGIFDMRKHYGWYFRGFDGAKELRKKLVTLESEKEVKNVLKGQKD